MNVGGGGGSWAVKSGLPEGKGCSEACKGRLVIDGLAKWWPGRGGLFGRHVCWDIIVVDVFEPKVVKKLGRRWACLLEIPGFIKLGVVAGFNHPGVEVEVDNVLVGCCVAKEY